MSRITTLEEMNEYAVDLSMRNALYENCGIVVELTQQEYIKAFTQLNVLGLDIGFPKGENIDSYHNWFTVQYFGIKFHVTFKYEITYV